MNQFIALLAVKKIITCKLSAYFKDQIFCKWVDEHRGKKEP